jgi:hypothetical protein
VSLTKVCCQKEIQSVEIMLDRLIALSLLSVAYAALAQQPTPNIQKGPIQKTSAASGRQMFDTYLCGLPWN